MFKLWNSTVAVEVNGCNIGHCLLWKSIGAMKKDWLQWKSVCCEKSMLALES
jgi:hypothetical protein